MKKDVFGAQGDFTTSPEISQMFGEVRLRLLSIRFFSGGHQVAQNWCILKLIGVWYLNEWLLLKQLYGNDLPKSVHLVELGPGRGSLMNDVLKVGLMSF